MKIELAEKAAELLEVLKNKRTEKMHVLTTFQESLSTSLAGDVLSIYIDALGGPRHLLYLEGMEEINRFQQVLEMILGIRIDRAEVNVRNLEMPEQHDLEALRSRKDWAAVDLLMQNRMDPDAVYVCREHLRDPNQFYEQSNDDFDAYVAKIGSYRMTVQTWLDEAATAYFVYDNGGLRVIKRPDDEA
jgi:hypothetical protein